MKKLSTLVICILCICYFSKSYAQMLEADSLNITDLAEMSLEDLMNLEVLTGNMTGVQAKKSPTAITKITNEQIQLTQAPNLAALLEIYVPGLILMTHSEGNKIGMRGLIAAENYKLLLLVNGRNVTNMTYEGVITEIDMWDLNDIDYVEVIRGPGSVTYGTGAIAGVINIVSKKATTDTPTFKAGTAYNPMYRSSGGYLQFSKKTENLGVYAYSSVQRTLGQENPDYYSMNGDLTDDNRYLGKGKDDVTDPQDYLADGLDRPQIKAHLDINYKDALKVWARYTQSGQSRNMTGKTIITDEEGNEISQQNKRHVTLRSFSIFPQYDAKINDRASVNTMVGFDDQEYNRMSFRNTDYDWNHYNNRRDYAFSQKRLVAQSLFNYAIKDKLKLVAGLEYNRTQVTSPWGTDADHLLIREGSYIISDSTSSVYYTDENSTLQKNKGIEEVGEDGIIVHTYSFLFESSFQINDMFSVLASARVDKPSISNIMFSPRLALISELNDRNSLRLIAQRSLRMMPLRAQYLYHKYHKDDGDTQNESINALELAYTRIQGENLVINANVFYNEIDAVGFTGTALEFFGKQKQIGLELDAKYDFNNLTIGANHSFLKLLSFDWNEELKDSTNKNNITFSDYAYTLNKSGGPITLTSYGNDLNNWANNATRLFATYKMFDNKLMAHINTRLIWDYKGAYDEMRMYEEAYNNFDASQAEDPETFAESKALFENEKRLLENENAYQTEFRFNASISYKLDINNKMNLLMTVYSENLFGSTKRYYESTGSSSVYPSRLKFLEEPRTIGFKLHLNFL